MLKLKLHSSASLCPNPNLMDRWAKGKTNTSCHTYRSLNFGGTYTQIHICIRVVLHRPEVSHHDLDHLVEGHYFSP
jgi:hypothetical protein